MRNLFTEKTVPNLPAYSICDVHLTLQTKSIGNEWSEERFRHRRKKRENRNFDAEWPRRPNTRCAALKQPPRLRNAGADSKISAKTGKKLNSRPGNGKGREGDRGKGGGKERCLFSSLTAIRSAVQMGTSFRPTRNRVSCYQPLLREASRE